MTITKTSLSKDSILNDPAGYYNYVDSFQGTFHDAANKITSTDIGKAFFTSGPKWIGLLLALRDRIVSVFGLKTSGDINERERQLKNFQCEPGEQLGVFKVFAKTANEVILGEDDKHLNFRVSLLLQTRKDQDHLKELSLSTAVKFNNWIGRLYFLPVRPLHRLIASVMLKAIIARIEKNI